ncbi:hypothetical protein DAI22_12g192133 [Oryza sativa Japonica Group]|nr:hypothetical protein DAI22_12g192133 [Oryza sativa Japonica Group]
MNQGRRDEINNVIVEAAGQILWTIDHSSQHLWIHQIEQ